MKFREFRETSSKPVENTDIYEEMTERANEINSLLESIKIEDDEFEKGVSDIDQKWIRENESKEYSFTAPVQAQIDNIKQQYLNAVKRLALDKIKNDLLFEVKLGTAMKNLSSMGLNVSKESMLKDIEREVNRQRMSLDFDIPSVVDTPNTSVERQSEIEQLKNNLGSIFESAPVQEQKPIYNSGPIPREPAIQSTQPYETTINNTSSQINQPVANQTPISNEQEVRQQLQQAQEEIKQKLEWAKQQPNEPTMTFTGNLENLSDNVKKRIIQQMESRGQGDVIISGIDNIYQEGNYIVVDAKQSNGRFVGAEFTIDDFNKIINTPLQQVDEQQQKINQESNIPQNNFDKDLIMFIEAKNSNLGKVSEILSVTGYPDSTYEVRFEDGTTHQITVTQDEKNFIKSHPPVQQPVQEKQSEEIITPVQPVVEHSQQQVSQEESEKILLDQQKQMKDQVINQIMGAMNKSGELSFGDISMGERMSIMQNIQNKLNAKSMDELQMLLSTYQEQNIQEETMSNGMRR